MSACGADNRVRAQRFGVTIRPMPGAGPKRQPEETPAEHHSPPQIYTLETTGLLVIAVLVLILTLIRYWHNIPWNAR